MTTTDNLATPNKTSLQIETIAVRADNPSIPGDQSLVIAGTGLGAKLFEFEGTGVSKSIGTLRSTDGGSTWNQVGPTWCASGDAACRQAGSCVSAIPSQCPGTDPTLSTINVKEILLDESRSPVRVWAATNMGLWWSDNLVTASSAGAVSWPLVTPPSVCQSGCLPKRNSATPEIINHIFMSPLNSDILYASASGSPIAANDGWYRSTDRGATWTKRSNGLPPDTDIFRAAIAKGGVTGTDTLYTIVSAVPSPECPLNPNGSVSTRERVYKTADSGATWQLMSPSGTCEGAPCAQAICDCCLSIQVDPQNPNHVVAGGVQLYRSTDGWNSASRIGLGIIHPDQNALTFDPGNPNRVFVGNDGGIWCADLNLTPINWTFRNGNLGNLEFYAGGIDTLNYGVSAGGTQDNGVMRGGSSLDWTDVGVPGDGVKAIIDPTNSNVAYFSRFPGSTVFKTTDGGASVQVKDSGFPTPVDVHSATLVMDPKDNLTLLA